MEQNHFGTGPYYNIYKHIELRSAGNKGSGLFAKEFIPKNTVVWKYRENSPAHLYHKIDIDYLSSFPTDIQQFIIRYGYQIDKNIVISPCSQYQVDLDYSNYWNHSCDPNCLPLDNDHWVTIKDINKDEELTIDYCTFDNNEYSCIDKCYCGTSICRGQLQSIDCLDLNIIQKYRFNFLPHIRSIIEKYYDTNIYFIN